MNFAFIDLIEVICSRNLENNEIFLKFKQTRSPFNSDLKNEQTAKPLLIEQMCNLADLIIHQFFLEHHYIDYQWPNSISNDNDDNFDGEVESIKLFIERFFINFFVVVINNILFSFHKLKKRCICTEYGRKS